MQLSERLKLFLMFLLVVVVCVTLKCQLKGGMALYQHPKRLDLDKNKCTFTSLIHAFTANKTLNRHVCDVLEKRMRRGQYSQWKELHNILCNPEYTQKIICTTQQYLPIDVFGDSLQHSLTRMKQSGLPKETYALDIDTNISPNHRIGGWTALMIYEMIPYLLDRKYKYDGSLQYNVPVYSGAYVILEDSISPIQSFFLYALIDFEAAIIGIKGHVVTITKTNRRRDLYTYYDDYEGFKPVKGKRDILLIYYLLKKVKSIEDLVTITERAKFDYDQYKILKGKAKKWTYFFLKLDLQNVEFIYDTIEARRSESQLSKAEATQKLYHKLAIFITNKFKRYVYNDERSNVSSIINEIKVIARECNFIFSWSSDKYQKDLHKFTMDLLAPIDPIPPIAPI